MTTLFRQLFSRSKCGSGTKIEPIDLSPPPPAAPPASLSAFVRGLIKSMETEPGQWQRYFQSCLLGRCWRHEAHLVKVSEGSYFDPQWRWDEEPGTVEGFETTAAERAAIFAALTKYVIEPERRKSEEGMQWLRDQHQRDLAERRAVFEKLGES